MSNLEPLSVLLSNKVARQAALTHKLNELENIDDTIFSSKLFRTFGTSYLILKRYLTLVLGILIVIGGIVLIVYPNVLLQDKSFKEELIEESKLYYSELAGYTLKEAVVLVAKDDSGYTLENFLSHFDEAFDLALEQELRHGIMFFGGILLFVAIVLLYISRLTRKMWVRNSKISEAESTAQVLIANYKNTIAEEQAELESLNRIVQRVIAGEKRHVDNSSRNHSFGN